MKCPSAALFWFVGCCGLSRQSLSAARDVPVNIVVDFTEAGRKAAHPTPANPAYYFPIASSFQELGNVVAGEKPPDQKEVLHSIALALAGQGYLLARPGFRTNANEELIYADGTTVEVPANPSSLGRGRLPTRKIPLTSAMLSAADGPYSLAQARKATPAAGGAVPPIVRALQTIDPVHGAVLARMPSLILMIRYGYLNPSIVDVRGQGPRIFFNQDQMLGLVGGNTLNHMAADFQREDVLQASEEDRYFISVTAFDYEVYAATRKKVVLWQAKISTPSHGIEKFSDVNAAMVTAGADSFGRETRLPVVVHLHQTPDGKVEVGPLTVTGVSEPQASPPAKP